MDFIDKKEQVGGTSQRFTTRKAVTVSYELDLSGLPAYKNYGNPDVKASITLKSESGTVNLVTKLHSEVIAAHGPGLNVFFNAKEGKLDLTLTGEAAHLEIFLEYLYSEQLSPDDLLPVFKYARQLNVQLNQYSLALALCCKNTLEFLDILETFEDHPASEFLYRTIVLDKVAARASKMLNSPYFPQLKADTLSDVYDRARGKVDKETLNTALRKWAQMEYGRQTLNTDTPTPGNVYALLPDSIKATGHEELRAFFMKREQEDKEKDPMAKRARGDAEDIYLFYTFSNKTFVRINRNSTVEALKALLEEKEGVAQDELRIIFDGRQLEDGRRLADYNFETKSTIHLIRRLRGC